VKFALRSSLCPVLACSVLGVGSVKVECHISEATSCVLRQRTYFRCRV